MAPEVQKSPLSQSTLAFQQLLENFGSSQLSEMEILNAADRLYKAALVDPVLESAAFGMAVAVISTHLKVSLRSAALIFATIVDLRG